MVFKSSTGDQANEQGPWSPAGEIYGYSYAEGDPNSMEEQSYAGGVKRKKVLKKKKKPLRKGKVGGLLAERRKQKAVDAANTKLAIKAASKSPGPVVKLSAPKEKKGLSTGAKWGIGIGIAAVLGIGAYFLIKKK